MGTVQGDVSSGAVLVLSGGTMAGPLAMGNNNITGIKQVGFGSSIPTANKTGAAPALVDWTAGSIQEIVLTGNVTGTPTFTAPSAVGRISLRVKQDATGSRTMTWPTAVDWGSAGAPTLTTGAGKMDWFTFMWDGSTYQAMAGIGAWG